MIKGFCKNADIDIDKAILKNIDKEILENIDIDIDKDILENIDIVIDIDKEILENIDIDKEILENIDIDKISNQLEFGISNRAIMPHPSDLPIFATQGLLFKGGAHPWMYNIHCILYIAET